MSNEERNPTRFTWLEFTSAANQQSAYVTQSEAETNNILPFRASRLETATTSAVVATTKTTITSRATDDDNAGNFADEKNSGSDSAASVKRITASPGKIKTQIAKISYSHHVDKPLSFSAKTIRPITTMVQRIQLESTSPQMSPRTTQYIDSVIDNIEEYAKAKKQERKQEINQIKEMLEDMTIDPPIFKEFTNESKKLPYETSVSAEETNRLPEEGTVPSEQEAPLSRPELPTSPTVLKSSSLVRSKTDINLWLTKAATTRRRNPDRVQPTAPRSKSSQPPATKSRELLPGGSPERKPAYDRAETRRFMEEQRKKRRMLEAFNTNRSQIQTALEKEQIKQRLEELRKNSRKIVSKNLKNAQKRTGNVATASGGASPSKTAKMDVIFKRSQDKNAILGKNKSTNGKKTDLFTGNAENHNIKTDKKPEAKEEGKSNTLSGALMENQKRVGLLRKSEIKDHSFSAIKEFSFDKENVALDLLTPKLTTPYETSRIKDVKLLAPASTSVAGGHSIAQGEVQQTEVEIREDQQHRTQDKVQEEQEQQQKKKLAEEKEEHPPNERAAQDEQQHWKKSTSLKKEQEQKQPPIAPGEEVHSSFTYNLEVPDSDLRAINRGSVHEQPVQVNDPPSLMIKTTQEPVANERSELPFWLKPSSVQAYPFNFIMAVRRKLEAIANPAATSSATVAETANKISSIGEDLKPKKFQETPLSSMTKQGFDILPQPNNAKRRLITNVIEESDSSTGNSGIYKTHTIEDAPEILKKPINVNSEEAHRKSQETPLLKSQTLSDITSNFSSVSLQLAVSNTGSEVSSIKSDTKFSRTKTSRHPRKADDDTTISSSIFNSPEKHPQSSTKHVISDNEGFKIPRRPVSPLSLERIEHLRISSKKKTAEPNSNKYSNVSKHVSSKHDHKDQKCSSHKLMNVTKVEVDFNSLLQDFNRSLSQVIEVNQQLKTTINKSHQIFRPLRSGENKDNDDYSSNFESGSSLHDATRTKTSISDPQKTHNLPARKKGLFDLNAVKPLQIHTQSGSESENNALELNINLDSVEISSTTQTEHSKKETLNSARDDACVEKTSSIVHKLGKRLKAIEHLKENLKRDLLVSRANCDEQIESENERKTNEPFRNSNDAGVLEGVESDIKQDPKRTKKKTRRNYEKSDNTIKINIEVEGDLEFSKKPTDSVDRSKVSSKSSSGHHSSPACLETFHKDSAQLSVSTQAVDVNTMLSSPPSSAKEMNTSNSGNQKTFSIENNIEQSPSTTARKSLNFDNQSIEEELQQNTVEVNSRHSNNNNNIYNNANSAPFSKTKSLSSKGSSAVTSERQNSEAFIKSHINHSRGDFLYESNEKSFNNESCDFQTVASLSVNSSEGGLVPPPSYGATKPKPSPSTKQNNDQTKKMLQMASLKKSSKPFPIGREYVAVFNQSDLEVSIISSQNGSVSETSLNYSSVGLYEKLIQTETTKSEHLSALLKLREKALIDRTKGQIAWLEVQKERYKSRGLLMQIAAIKKKQRGILMKMEREREEIKRLLQSTTTTTSTAKSSAHLQSNYSAGQQQQTSPSKRHRVSESRKTPPLLPPLPLLPKSTRISGAVQQQQQKHQHPKHQHKHHPSSAAAPPSASTIVRANYDLESSHILEELLQKREADLRRRRQHVERLMLWHQRLDQEEAEVQQLERMLLNYNNAHASELKEEPFTPSPKHQKTTAESRKEPPSTVQGEQAAPLATSSSNKTSSHEKQRRAGTHDTKMERRLKEIERSLRELSSISVSKNSAATSIRSENSAAAVSASASASASTATSDHSGDYVRTSGSKLNKLWRRLTTQDEELFDSTRRYKLCKADLERLYEEAKLVVLRDFSQDEERVAVDLLDKTAATMLSQSSACETQSPESNHLAIKIPRLNLNSSSDQSEPEEEEEAAMELTEEERDVSAASLHEPVADTTLTVSGGTYSPSAAEEDHVIVEHENTESSVSPASSSCSSWSQNCDSHELEVATPLFKLQRETLLERNVQKFMELTQRFSNTQDGSNLQRSLSDTQLADNGSGASKCGKSTSTFGQRNITHAYYGVKRPSMVVNVEIANSLSNASSILTAASLRTPQSVGATTSSKANCEAVNRAADLQANIIATSNNNIPLSFCLSAADSTVGSQEKNTQSRNSLKLSPPRTNSGSATPTNSKSTTTSISSTPVAAFDVQPTSSDIQANVISSKIAEISLAVSLLPAQSNNALSGGAGVEPGQRQLEQGTTFHTPKSAPSTQATEPTSGSSSYSLTFDDNESELISSPVDGVDGDGEPATRFESNNSSASISPLQSVAAPTSTTSPTGTAVLHLKAVGDTALMSESLLLDKYQADFEHAVDGNDDETRLEDLSMPHFETTLETTQNDEDTDQDNNIVIQGTVTLETPALQREHFFPKTSNDDNEASPSSTSSCSEHRPPPPMPPPPPPPLLQVPSTSKDAAAAANQNNNNNNNSTSQQQQQQLMPDIINELELRRCQPQQKPTQQQQYEHVTAVPYNMYLREIPNKPPPPYVPPAHGSPMTTIFPSEDRIKDLTYRRTHELYCEILKTEYTNEKGEKLPSVLAEKITNIYERIILDICREYLEEHQDILAKADPRTFHSKLAFFNPPDRLTCLQKFVYQEVRRCLAMDKKQPKRTQVYSVYGQRAKRDHIGQIIIQEMYDEDDKWCNFHLEESEVLDLIIEEMIKNVIDDTTKQVLVEEGGHVEEETNVFDEHGNRDGDGNDVEPQNTHASEPSTHNRTNESLSSLMSDEVITDNSVAANAATAESENVAADKSESEPLLATTS